MATKKLIFSHVTMLLLLIALQAGITHEASFLQPLKSSNFLSLTWRELYTRINPMTVNYEACHYPTDGLIEIDVSEIGEDFEPYEYEIDWKCTEAKELQPGIYEAKIIKSSGTPANFDFKIRTDDLDCSNWKSAE
jgi:hypothetical protein